MRLLKIVIGIAGFFLLTACGESGEGSDESVSEGNTIEKNTAQASQVVNIAILGTPKYEAPKVSQVFSLNNEWDQGFLDRMNLDVTWVAGGGENFVTSIYGNGGYTEKRAICEEDFKEVKADGNRKCYPRLTLHSGADEFSYKCAQVNFPQMRYGYHCGKGFGGNAAPLDAVDACCRWHDLQKWKEGGENINSNQKGMVMCLSAAQSRPVNLLEYPVTAYPVMTEIVASRECWYDWAAGPPGGALGEQPEDAPTPEPYVP